MFLLIPTGLFLTFGEQGLLAIKNRDLDEIRKKVAGEAKRDESISQGMEQALLRSEEVCSLSSCFKSCVTRSTMV